MAGVTSEDCRYVLLIAINFIGPLHCFQAVLPGMVERGGGRIVSVSSDAGRNGSTGEAVYSGAKAGIMVTASHNPEDQNGIKAFVGPLATKLYPIDEERLTRRVYGLAGRKAESPGGPGEEGREGEVKR